MSISGPLIERDFSCDADRLVVVFSDVEMGAGGEQDDSPHSGFLGELLLRYLDGPWSDCAIDFVFNGDTFDLLKTPYLATYPRHVTQEVAVGKMSRVAAAHPRFFEALSRILEDPRENKSVYFVLGNHDPELLFPKVQGFVRALCGNAPNLHFPGFELSIGPVRIEHGCQSDPLFRIDPQKPFIQADGTRLLNLSWATVALLDIAMPVHPLLHFHDRLRPRNQVMAMVPEIRELLVAKAWHYWTRDFWRDFIALKDPVLKFNWTMVREIVKRFTTSNPEVSFNKRWLKAKVEQEDGELFVTGHLHQVGTYYHGTKRVLQAGCFRDEYFVLDDGKRFQPILKPFYEIHLKEGRVLGIVTEEIQGPDRPRESFPDSVYDIVPQVKALLEELGDRSRERENQKRQELAEAVQEPSD